MLSLISRMQRLCVESWTVGLLYRCWEQLHLTKETLRCGNKRFSVEEMNLSYTSVQHHHHMKTVHITTMCKPGASMSAPPPPLERTIGPPENQQKLSLAYVTAASETQHTVQFTPCTYGLIIFPCSPFSSPLSSSPRTH